ncbi:MAG: hypothetical protein IT244_12670 [Bacteroidia bacterium]|nr:hypothetical protein [Bacteroidia bacterium]
MKNTINPETLKPLITSSKWMRIIAIIILIVLCVFIIGNVIIYAIGGNNSVIEILKNRNWLILAISGLLVGIFLCIQMLRTAQSGIQMEENQNDYQLAKFINNYYILQFILMGFGAILALNTILGILKLSNYGK